MHSRGERGRKGRECKFRNKAHRILDIINTLTPAIIAIGFHIDRYCYLPKREKTLSVLHWELEGHLFLMQSRRAEMQQQRLAVFLLCCNLETKIQAPLFKAREIKGRARSPRSPFGPESFPKVHTVPMGSAPARDPTHHFILASS